MSMPFLRALRRAPLLIASVAMAISAGGVAAARLATDDGTPARLRMGRTIDTAHADAPPPRALGLTAAYFETLGIITREVPVEKATTVAPPPRAECDPHAANRLAKRAAPKAPRMPVDSSHLTTARLPHELRDSTSSRVSPTIAFPSE